MVRKTVKKKLEEMELYNKVCILQYKLGNNKVIKFISKHTTITLLQHEIILDNGKLSIPYKNICRIY